MLNNKGQSLILFIMIIPIMLLILIFIIDIGRAISLKYELINISDIVLDYGLDHMDENGLVNQLEELVIINKNDIDDVSINIIDDKIYIKLYERYEGMFSSLIDVSIFEIKTSYVGYILEEEKRIESLGD